MSEPVLKSVMTGLIIVAAAVLVLLGAASFGWIAPGYRSALSDVLVVLVLVTLVARYVQEKENRAFYRAYALWAIVISIPMVGLAFLRDYSDDAWFQSTLFPKIFLPVMLATLLGYAALAIFFVRTKWRGK